MTLLTAIAIGTALGVGSLSFWAIRRASNRPANGELKTLARLDEKIIKNQKCILKHFVEYHHLINHKAINV